MSPVFLDANIFLDVFSHRLPFYQHSAEILTLAEQQQMSAYTSSLNFSNLFYILRKQHSRDMALTCLQQISSFVRILPVNEQTITLALHSSFTDFEDAIQYYTAMEKQIPFFVTRNIKDFSSVKKEIMQVITPEKYMQLWKTALLSNVEK